MEGNPSESKPEFSSRIHCAISMNDPDPGGFELANFADINGGPRASRSTGPAWWRAEKNRTFTSEFLSQVSFIRKHEREVEGATCNL